MGVPFKKEGKGTYIVKECVVVGGERIKTLMSGGGVILPHHDVVATELRDVCPSPQEDSTLALTAERFLLAGCRLIIRR
jgi:hypothetical protein